MLAGLRNKGVSMNSDTPRRFVIGSAIVAGLLGFLAVWDMFAVYPYRIFAGQIVFDIVFLTSACMILYMSYDAWQDFPDTRMRKHDLNQFGRHLPVRNPVGRREAIRITNRRRRTGRKDDATFDHSIAGPNDGWHFLGRFRDTSTTRS